MAKWKSDLYESSTICISKLKLGRSESVSQGIWLCQETFLSCWHGGCGQPCGVSQAFASSLLRSRLSLRR